MAAIQLTFNLRTSPNAKTVHLLGNWDGYQGQLPLSKDHSKTGGWKGTFRFQGSTLQQGSRYWYYYIIDGYHVSHDPSKPSTIEPTTKRALNVLDIPASKLHSASGSSNHSSRLDARHPPSSRLSLNRLSTDIPKGRALSPSRIVSPRPLHPNATRTLEAAAASSSTLRSLTSQFAGTSLSSSSFESDSDSDTSDVPSLSSSRSSSSSGSLSSSPGARSPASPASSVSSCCTCEKYGITRGGARVRIDCGGTRCGDGGSSCASESESDDGYYRTRLTVAPSSKLASGGGRLSSGRTSAGSGSSSCGSSKRNGVVVRGSSRRY